MSRSILPDIYRIVFRPKALKAFEKLSFPLQRQLARKLEERRTNPEVPAARLRELPNCYKIKLRSSGVRAVYQVRNGEMILLVLSVGGREREEVYRMAATELKTRDD